MRSIPAGEFKAKCLKIMDEVAATGEPVLVTKRGKPVVSVSIPSGSPRDQAMETSIFGCLRGLGTINGDPDALVSSEFTDAEWERMFQEKWDRYKDEDAH